MQCPGDISNQASRKKKPLIPQRALYQSLGRNYEEVRAVPRAGTSKSGKMGLRRNMLNDVPIMTPQPERSNSDSLADPSSVNDYRALRRKYLLLEEESCMLEKELELMENEVKSLEDEKLALLDQLVVLEGLINPSELLNN